VHKRLSKTELVERSHNILDLLVRISMSRFPYGRASEDDEARMPYWQDEALVEFTKLSEDVRREFDYLQGNHRAEAPTSAGEISF
jgi:hypothetical protein